MLFRSIEIADIVWQPAGAERATLDLRGVRLRVPAGGLLVVCGPSGAGKTTLLRAIAGLLGTLVPGELRGTLVVGGVDLVAASNGAAEVPQEHVRGLGFLAAGPAPTWALPRLADDAALPLEARRVATAAMVERENEVARYVGLTPNHLERSYGEMSGGERTAATAAVAIVAQPTLLLADEPFLGLDAAAAATLRGALIAQRATRVIATHDDGEFRDCEPQVLVLGAGPESVASERAPRPRAVVGAAANVDAEPIVQLSDATVAGRRVDPLQLTVRRGEALVVGGSTGSGKSKIGRAHV